MKSPLFVGESCTVKSVPGTAPASATACLQLKGLPAVRGRLATKPAGGWGPLQTFEPEEDEGWAGL